MDDKIQELEYRLKAQDKTIRVLSERLERQMADDISGFALFEQNIALENVVTTRTRELEEHRVDLERALAELKETQTELLQAQKLQAIGQLAAGIAHEINTPTQYVGNNISFLRDLFGDLMRAIQLCQGLLKEEAGAQSIDGVRSTIKQAFEMIDFEFLQEDMVSALSDCEEGVNRISVIVGAMKDFAHPSGGNLRPVALQKLIQSTIEISRNEWKLLAELKTELDPGLPTVEGLKDELGQVLLNLIINAAHAIADANPSCDKQGLIRILTRRNGNWAEILVEDNGCGIPEELHQKIFEPFFTTKEVGRGSGQGLAIVYNVVAGKHQGEVLVDSEPGKGARFTVRLPLGKSG
jgi:signal transduction histidine kinase